MFEHPARLTGFKFALGLPWVMVKLHVRTELVHQCDSREHCSSENLLKWNLKWRFWQFRVKIPCIFKQE